MIDFEIVANFESPFGHGGAADVEKMLHRRSRSSSQFWDVFPVAIVLRSVYRRNRSKRV